MKTSCFPITFLSALCLWFGSVLSSYSFLLLFVETEAISLNTYWFSSINAQVFCLMKELLPFECLVGHVKDTFIRCILHWFFFLFLTEYRYIMLANYTWHLLFKSLGATKVKTDRLELVILSVKWLSSTWL